MSPLSEAEGCCARGVRYRLLLRSPAVPRARLDAPSRSSRCRDALPGSAAGLPVCCVCWYLRIVQSNT